MANTTGVNDTINLDALNSEIEDIKAGMDAMPMMMMRSMMLQIPLVKSLPLLLRSNLDIIYSTLYFNVYIAVQICKSPQAHVFFKKCCTEANVTFLELLKWIWTCWASLYKMLEQLLWLFKVFTFWYKMHHTHVMSLEH